MQSNSPSDWVHWIGTNPWLSITSFVFTILSLGLAVFFYLRSKKTKAPCYATRSVNIVRDLVSKIASLEMLYAGQKIENITATKLVLWNAGRDTIHRHDIASGDLLVIQIEGDAKILNAQILSEKNQANKISVNPSNHDSSYLIDFEYIDYLEGAVFQILHTGKSGKDIKLQGTVKGAGKLARKTLPRIRTLPIPLPIDSSTISQKAKRRILAFVAFITPILFTLILFNSRLDETKSMSINSRIASAVFVFAMYWGLGYFLFRERLPKGFDAFDEDF